MNEVVFLLNPEGVKQVGFSWSPARNIGMHKIINGAFEILRKKIKKEFSVHVATGDFPLKNKSKDSNVIYFDMVSDDFNKNDIFPDFIFGNWVDMGLEDWDQFVGEIQQNNNVDKIKDERLFWSGSLATSCIRQVYIRMCEINPIQFCGSNISWIQKGNGITEPNISFVSWKDHCRYKYLLDLPGHSWGTRLKFIPYCNRPLFVSERSYWTWSCVEILKQNLHISIREDLSDLIEKYKWADDNQELVFSNATKLLNFCLEHFSFKNICQRAADLIVEKI
jgi:hypothetical protein